MASTVNYKKIHVLLIGVVHEVQAKGHIKWHIQKMRERRYAEDILNMIDAYLKKMRDGLLQLCEQENPDVVFEEGGAYNETPGDRWKAWIRSGKTILEEKFGDKHVFVDAKMPRFLRALREPGDRKREKAFIQGIEDCLRGKEDIRNIVFVVGSAHLERVERLLKEKGFQVKVRNLKDEFRTDELKQKVKEEARRLKEERIRAKKKPFWKF